MKKFILALLFAGTLTCHAQDPIFTQQQFGWSSLNPAYAGSLACARAETGYRMQWPNISGFYNTFNAAYDQYFKAGGVGFNYMHDNSANILKTNRCDLNYSYSFQLFRDSLGKGKVVIQPGVQVSWQTKTIDWDQLTFGDMIDPRRGFVFGTNEQAGSLSVSNIDFSAGFLIYTKRILFGYSVYHISQPNEGFLSGNSPLPYRTVLHVAGILGNADSDEDKLGVIPSILYIKQGGMEQAVVMITTKFRNASFGIGYRNLDALLFAGSYTYRDITLSYSYDLTISDLGPTGGAHELHLGYRFLKEKWSAKRTNLRMFF